MAVITTIARPQGMLLRSGGLRFQPFFGLHVRTLITKASVKTTAARLRSVFQVRLAQLDRLFLIGVTRFHEITGYNEIEQIKRKLAQLEIDLETTRTKVRESRELYNSRIAQRSGSQREMNELLMRKSSWLEPDLERFTQLYKADHEIQLGVEDAKKNYDQVEAQMEEMQLQVGKLIGARYREEQMFSDRIRQASTWGTWVLMGINILLFVVVQLILEPWKRRRLVRSFEAKVQQMITENSSTNEGVTTVAIEPKPVTFDLVAPQLTPADSLSWSNLWDRLQKPEVIVRPAEVGALALLSTIVAGVLPLFVLAISDSALVNMAPKKSLPKVTYLRPAKMSAVENGAATGTCLPVLINMLNCWASYKEGSPQCEQFVTDLKACMARGHTGKPERKWLDYTKYLRRLNPPAHD